MAKSNDREELIEALAQVDMADQIYLEILKHHPEAEATADRFMEAFDLQASRKEARESLD